jgi:hypothetical protein
MVGRAQRNPILRAEACGRTPHPIHESAVTAARIAEKKAVGVAIDQCMRARYFRTRNAKVAVRAAADRKWKMIDGDSAGRLARLWLRP